MGCVKSGNDREVPWREGNGEVGLLRGGGGLTRGEAVEECVCVVCTFYSWVMMYGKKEIEIKEEKGSFFYSDDEYYILFPPAGESFGMRSPPLNSLHRAVSFQDGTEKTIVFQQLG